MYDFVAIDFETATEYMSSACAVGIVAIEDFQVIDKFYSLVRPPENAYNDLNVSIHQITPDMTEKAPALTDLWPQISHFFDEHIPVVAHNAQFDMSVLCMSVSSEIPDFVYVDSMDVAASFVGGSRSLVNCAVEMGIDLDEFNHHNALDDARLCAEVTSLGIAGFGCKTMWELLAKNQDINRRSFSDLHPLYIMGRGRKKPRFVEQVKPKKIQRTVETVDESCPLCGKSIVFTGQLTFDRAEAMQIAVNCGALVKTSVSKKTDYLVVGTQDKALVGEDGMSSKEEKAYQLNESGVADIKILSEQEFLALASVEV